MIAVKEAYNVSIESCFLQTDGEELMVERRKELGNIKHYDASIALFEPLCINNVGQIYSCISDRSLSDTPQLIRIQKAVGYHMKLQSVADNFLNQFSSCIEEYNGLERARHVM